MRPPLTFLALLLLPLAAFTDAPAVSFDRYHSYRQLTQALETWQSRFPGYARVRSLGKSFRSREIWLLTITDSKSRSAKRV